MPEVIRPPKASSGIPVEAFGARADNGTTDNSPPIQRAMDYVGSEGGGRVVCAGRGAYECSAFTTQGTFSANLVTRYDNVELVVESGSILRGVSNARLLACGGMFKPEGVANQNLYNARNSINYGNRFTLYAIDPATKYSNQITLVSVGDSVNFEVGDDILIRTGEVRAAGTFTPFGEFNRILAIDSGTLTLQNPLRGNYAQENYITGHPSAGLPAPFGIVNCTRPYDVMLRNFKITGKGTLENLAIGSASGLLSGNQMTGRVVDGPTFVARGTGISNGSTLERWINSFIFASGEALAYSQDSCNHDFLLNDTTIINSDQQAHHIHMHEGSSGKIGSGVTLISALPGANKNALSIRSRAHDIVVGDIKIFGWGSDDSSAIFADITTDRIVVGSPMILGPLSEDAPAVSLLGSNSQVGMVNTDSVVGVVVSAGLGNRNLDALVAEI